MKVAFSNYTCDTSLKGAKAMETLVIKPKNRADSQKIREFAEKMGAKQKTYSDEEMEDIGMAFLMSEVDRTEYVSKEEVMKKLQGE